MSFLALSQTLSRHDVLRRSGHKVIHCTLCWWCLSRSETVLQQGWMSQQILTEPRSKIVESVDDLSCRCACRNHWTDRWFSIPQVWKSRVHTDVKIGQYRIHVTLPIWSFKRLWFPFSLSSRYCHCFRYLGCWFLRFRSAALLFFIKDHHVFFFFVCMTLCCWSLWLWLCC